MVERNKGSSAAIMVLVLVAGLLIGGMVSAYVLLRKIGSLEEDISTLESQISRISGNQTVYNQTITVYQNVTALAEMYQKIKDSVVLIQGRTGTEAVQGSGFVYNLTGSMIVVTNNHVVAGMDSLSVTFSDGNGYASVVEGRDPYADLAVLSVVNASESEFSPLEIASSSTLEVGDPVIAVGAPFGLVGSMTTGVISGLGRTISEEEYTGGFAIANVIQTSAPINPGNSGGPLLNFDGKVIGITAAIITDSQGVGFAIPSNTILREMLALYETGAYSGHSYLGVKGSDMDYFTAQSMHTDVTYGWVIAEIVSGGPAYDAGLQVNDILIAIDDHPIGNGDEMSSYLEEHTLPGESVILKIVRGSQLRDLQLVLGTRPPPP